MNTQHTHEPPKIRSKPFRRVRYNSRSKETIQFIYAHLPPAIILATAQHLRAQTQIEQRAQQLWFANDGHKVGALENWLRAEREVVQNLCKALLHRKIQEPESTPACH